jgi:mannose-6-phosphate isomerase-like protein (cupin superfamily)
MQPVVNEFENITVDQQHEKHSFGRFDLNEMAAAFPATAETLLLDTYLTNEDAASARIFRVYRGTPAHYHAWSDEYLYVLSGKGTFWMESRPTRVHSRPGTSCSSSAAPSMPCQRSARVPWYSYRWTRPGVIQKTSSLSIQKTGPQTASSNAKGNELVSKLSLS